MSVYVDNLIQHDSENVPPPFRRQPTCHMYADTVEELHAMADRIGLKRIWFQNHHPEFPHYDLVPVRRNHALQLGAVATDRRHVVEFVRARRGRSKAA